jgi:hypothetical protein
MSAPITDISTARIRRLHRQAERSHPLVAQAFRRRACELELETWARRQHGPSANPDLLPAA